MSAEIIARIISNQSLSRADVYELIADATTLSEAKSALETAFTGFDPESAGYQLSLTEFLGKIFADLPSYKEWENE